MNCWLALRNSRKVRWNGVNQWGKRFGSVVYFQESRQVLGVLNEHRSFYVRIGLPYVHLIPGFMVNHSDTAIISLEFLLDEIEATPREHWAEVLDTLHQFRQKIPASPQAIVFALLTGKILTMQISHNISRNSSRNS
jgi:hypothetical protein